MKFTSSFVKAEKYPLDYLKEIDASTLEEADAELYESLTQKLSA